MQDKKSGLYPKSITEIPDSRIKHCKVEGDAGKSKKGLVSLVRKSGLYPGAIKNHRGVLKRKVI